MEKDELARAVEEARVSMLRLALSITGRGADAEDAVSAAIVSAFENRQGLRDAAKAPAWLLTITARKCYDLLRHQRTALPEGSVPETPVFQENIENTRSSPPSASSPEATRRCSRCFTTRATTQGPSRPSWD